MDQIKPVALRPGKLPLKQITNLGQLDVEDFEGKSYPFEPFVSRNGQIATYTRLYDGDFTEFVDEQPIIAVNEFQKVSKRMAELMLAEEPQFTGQDLSTEMQDEVYNTTYDTIINQMTYGLGIMTAVGQTIESQNPAMWYPGTGDYDIIVDFADYKNDGPQTIIIDVYDGETIERRRHRYNGTPSDGVVKESLGTESLGSGMLVPVYRLPIGDGWGTSVIPNLLPMTLGKSNCYSRNDEILDEHSRPMLVVTKTKRQLENDGLEAFKQFDGKPSNTDIADRLAEQFGEDRIRNNGVYFKTEGDQEVEYVTWDGQLSSSFTQIEELNREINDFTGYTGDLTSGKGIPSGVALRRLLLPLYVATQALQNEIRKSLVELMSFVLGTDVEIEWPHPLVILDDPGGGQNQTPSDNNENLPQSQADEREPNVQ